MFALAGKSFPTTTDQLVDHYLGLLVDADATAEARQALIDYLNGAALDDSAAIDVKARGLMHLAMAVPTYQLA